MNASDEGRHEPGGPDWLERWSFEAWAEDATFLEVGTRAASDSATYSDVDLFSPPHQQPALYTHRDGTPYPKRDRTGPATT